MKTEKLAEIGVQILQEAVLDYLSDNRNQTARGISNGLKLFVGESMNDSIARGILDSLVDEQLVEHLGDRNGYTITKAGRDYAPSKSTQPERRNASGVCWHYTA